MPLQLSYTLGNNPNSTYLTVAVAPKYNLAATKKENIIQSEKLDCSINYGIGYAIKFRDFTSNIELQYQNGITNTLKKSYETKSDIFSKIKANYITASIILLGNKKG